ncbi:MAG: glycosyltransferase family 1 protein [Candidatus Omnitrophica bacterium]|nr:glycosyltransferase family 1 protein [Candidatus Omnitrophota bacterium]
MALKIVHIAKTAIAGAPIRLVQSLRRLTDYEVRLINWEREKDFDSDLVFSENPDQAIAVAEAADIIHLHNFIDLRTRHFAPLDFEQLRRQGKVFVRQFHSHPLILAITWRQEIPAAQRRAEMARFRARLANELPSLVVGQFQERYYPDAFVVPNLIPEQEPLYRPSEEPWRYGMCFTPSNDCSAWKSRWNTKGAPETMQLMMRVIKATKTPYCFLFEKPLSVALEQRRQALVVIDELVTGSFHLAGLEGLCQGKAVLAFLDERTQRVLRELSGSQECPFLNVRLEDAFDPLMYLLRNPDIARDIGRHSREWFEDHWAERKMIQHYITAYEILLQDPTQLRRQEVFRIRNRADQFRAQVLPDLVYHARRRMRRA